MKERSSLLEQPFKQKGNVEMEEEIDITPLPLSSPYACLFQNLFCSTVPKRRIFDVHYHKSSKRKPIIQMQKNVCKRGKLKFKFKFKKKIKKNTKMCEKTNLICCFESTECISDLEHGKCNTLIIFVLHCDHFLCE